LTCLRLIVAAVYSQPPPASLESRECFLLRAQLGLRVAVVGGTAAESPPCVGWWPIATLHRRTVTHSCYEPALLFTDTNDNDDDVDSGSGSEDACAVSTALLELTLTLVALDPVSVCASWLLRRGASVEDNAVLSREGSRRR
jgi:hypothetical protein